MRDIRKIWKALKCGAGEGWKKMSWTDCVRSEVLQGVKEERNIVHKIKRRNAKCIGQILRRNCLLRHVIEGKIKGRTEVRGRRRRRRNHLLEDFKETRKYLKMKEEALDRTLCRTRFGRGYGPLVRLQNEWINEWKNGQYSDRTNIIFSELTCQDMRTVKSFSHQQARSTQLEYMKA